MDDYSALAQRISMSVSGVSGALILSRDGLVLGSHPNEDESLAKPAWLKFIALGEPEKSFVEFHDQVWAYVKRGPYAAFATAEPGTRPGILVDQMEQALLVAEEGRSRRDTLRVPDSNAAPSGKPRTSLHPQGGRPTPAEVAEVATAAPDQAAAVGAASSDRGGFSRNPGASSGADDQPLTAAEAAEPAPPALEEEPPQPAPKASGEGVGDEGEVDRVLLAKEFSGLLQMDSDDDEASS